MIKKILRSIIGLVIAVVALVAIVCLFFLAPITSRTIKSRTGYDVKIQKMSVNPFTGTAIIDGFVLTNPAGEFKTPGFVDLTALHADVVLLSLFKDQLVVNSAKLDLPAVTLVRRASGPSNAELFVERLGGESAPAQKPAQKPDPEPSKPFKFLIKKLDLNLGKIVIASEPANGAPTSREVKINLKETYKDISDPKQLATQSPALASSLLGVGIQITDLIPGKYGDNVNKVLKDGAKILENPKEAAAGAAKGLLDKLKK